MATLTLIGEPFADRDAEAHTEAARELTLAVALAAPRGCSARLLVAADRDVPEFETARARSERLPLKASSLPLLWRTGLAARPLDGEFVHALTPLAAMRSRNDDDGSQTSVTVPHALGWLAPEAMGEANARQYRAFVKRAVRLADVIVTPTHATARALQERYGDIAVQVLPLPAPSGYLRGDDAVERRSDLGLPPRYLVTTATPGDTGRLDWIFTALERDPELPDLVVLEAGVGGGSGAGSGSVAAGSVAAGSGSVAAGSVAAGSVSGSGDAAGAESGAAREAGSRPAVPESLRERVHLVRPRELADVGAVLSGAELLVLPQRWLGAGYEVLGALASGVPVVHGGCEAVAELAFDAGVSVDDADELATELSRITRDDADRERLGILAEDRSRAFSWATAASALWELHANL